MMSLLFGIIIPFGVIILRRGLNIKIISKGDIAKVTTIPVIGEIGNSVNGEAIAVKKNSRTIISEQFRAFVLICNTCFTTKRPGADDYIQYGW